ncbi:MAG: DNA methyltransferase [Candidatus Freyarchaeota archaeon]
MRREKPLDIWLDLDLDKTLARVLKNLKVTFSDNMDEPVHRWFRFPAGFSAEFAKYFIENFSKGKGTVLDPFTGCGTTNVVAKSIGLPSIGVERHPLLAWIAKIKVRDYDLEKLKEASDKVLGRVRHELRSSNRMLPLVKSGPELLHKCYPIQVLCELYTIKNVVDNVEDEELKDFFLLALLCILRKVTDVDVGWPYILPRKKKRTPKPVFEAFKEQLKMMINDLKLIGYKNVNTIIYEADARNMYFIDDDSIDAAFTSPPYLNNYDYADRTRLELYFLRWASSWKEITEKVRSKLIVSCSHQAKEMGLKEGLQPSNELPPDVREELIEKSERLRREKYKHGGKKDYDIMVVAYFNDMVKTMIETYRVLKPGAYYGMVLGDSAPYGIHIPTDENLARIGKYVGFAEAKIYVLRERGSKWSYIVEAGRRHSVKLRESLVLFKK